MTSAPLKLFVKPERRFVAEGRPTELLVLVRITPSGTALGEEPCPLRLAVVLEASADVRWRDAQRQALLAMLKKLRPADELALVASGSPAVVLRRCEGLPSPEDVDAALDSVGSSSGPGPLFPAWYAAATLLAERWRSDAIHRVIALSGPSSRAPGPVARESALRAARGLWRRGIGTTTVGLGADADEDLLVPFAAESGGNAWNPESPGEIATALCRELAVLHDTWCEWSSVRFDTDGADVVELLNTFPWVGTNKIALPSLHRERSLHLVLRIRLSPTQAGEDMVPVTIRLKSLDLGGSDALVFRKGLRVHIVAPALADGMEPDLAVQAQAARLQLARTYRRCLEKLDGGDAGGVKGLLDFAVAQFRGLSGQQGGTLLTRELHTAVRLRECAGDPARTKECRRLLRYAAFWASRSDVAED